eukprot:TRINITY_DN345_c0_g1_i1.p1 TRINITY_DN345_c0_g1~~TRINITY_DN345_c0_g1_i1.p1  ORF type:complete len:221 (+),score=43.29 TRINITY_DN345_c0_g1_i1:30-665(+)
MAFFGGYPGFGPAAAAYSAPTLTNLAENDFHNSYANKRYDAQVKGGDVFAKQLAEDRHRAFVQQQARQGFIVNPSLEGHLDLLEKQKQYGDAVRPVGPAGPAGPAGPLLPPTVAANRLMVEQYRKKGNKHLTVQEAQNIEISAEKQWRAQLAERGVPVPPPTTAKASIPVNAPYAPYAPFGAPAGPAPAPFGAPFGAPYGAPFGAPFGRPY